MGGCEARRTSGGAFHGGLAAMALIIALVTDVPAQTACTTTGDRLDCSDGRSYRIYRDPWASRAGRSAPALPTASESTGPRREVPAEPSAPLDDRRLYGPDGLVCWPHLDHARCTLGLRPERAPAR